MSYRKQEIDQRLEALARQRQYQERYSQPQYEEDRYEQHPQQRYSDDRYAYPQQQRYEEDYDERQLAAMHGGKMNFGKIAKGVAKSRVLSTAALLSGNPAAAAGLQMIGAGGRFGGGLIGGRYPQDMYGGKMAKLKSRQYVDMGLAPVDYGVKYRKPRKYKTDAYGVKIPSAWQIFFDENYEDIKRKMFLELEARPEMYTSRQLHAMTMRKLGDDWIDSDDNPNPQKTIAGRIKREQAKATKAALQGKGYGRRY